MQVVDWIGHFFFRTRNALFPLLLITVLLFFQPPADDTGAARLLLFAGVITLAAGQGLRIMTIGLDYIRRGGRDGRIYASRLVTGGVFAHCRNPMYVGNVLMVTGFFLISGNPGGVAVGGVLSGLIYAAIVHSEEGYLAGEFGDAYAAYCRDVPRWMVRPGGLVLALRAHRFDWAAVVIREYGTLYTTALIALALFCWKQALAGTLDRAAVIAYLSILLGCSIAYALARFLKKTRRLLPLHH